MLLIKLIKNRRTVVPEIPLRAAAQSELSHWTSLQSLNESQTYYWDREDPYFETSFTNSTENYMNLRNNSTTLYISSSDHYEVPLPGNNAPQIPNGGQGQDDDGQIYEDVV